MPEGHTIHRIARDHSKLLEGRAIRVSSPQGRFTADAERVDGATLERIEPYGKHLFYLIVCRHGRDTTRRHVLPNQLRPEGNRGRRRPAAR